MPGKSSHTTQKGLRMRNEIVTYIEDNLHLINDGTTFNDAVNILLKYYAIPAFKLNGAEPLIPFGASIDIEPANLKTNTIDSEELKSQIKGEFEAEIQVLKIANSTISDELSILKGHQTDQLQLIESQKNNIKFLKNQLLKSENQRKKIEESHQEEKRKLHDEVSAFIKEQEDSSIKQSRLIEELKSSAEQQSLLIDEQALLIEEQALKIEELKMKNLRLKQLEDFIIGKFLDTYRSYPTGNSLMKYLETALKEFMVIGNNKINNAIKENKGEIERIKTKNETVQEKKSAKTKTGVTGF